MALSVIDNLLKEINSEIKLLSERLVTGGKLIDSELDSKKKEILLKTWCELDDTFKRLQLARACLLNPFEQEVKGKYCALCLGLVKEEDIKEFKLKDTQLKQPKLAQLKLGE